LPVAHHKDQATGMTFDALSKFPFNLDPARIAWVRERFAALDEDARLRQLFNLRSAGTNPEDIAAIRDFRPGGVTRHIGAGIEEERAIIAGLGDGNPLPLLISADLEGSRMSLPGGTEFPTRLALAAIDDVEATAEISRHHGGRGPACRDQLELHPGPRHQRRPGAAPSSPPVASARTSPYHRAPRAGADRVFQKNGIAATVKHWPGEGYDDRDQHLVTTINPLTIDEWEATFGRLYRGPSRRA
jgi:beta-N-acetylhexosaminidase